MYGDDLELKELEQFRGTEGYTKLLGTSLTDGVVYIMRNGYSWFVTDAVVILRNEEALEKQHFVSIELKLNKEKESAVVVYTDGNCKELYRQKYNFTNAKREVKLYYIDGVLLLEGEY